MSAGESRIVETVESQKRCCFQKAGEQIYWASNVDESDEREYHMTSLS